MSQTAMSQTEAVPQVPPRFDTSRAWRWLPAGMRRRWWLFRLFDLLARHWPVLRKPRGLLVVRMDGIGDMVLFRNALDHYAEAFGVDRAEITVLGCDSWKSLAAEVFAGYRVVTINEHRFAKRPFYRLRVSLMVRRLAPKIAVCDSYFRRALMADSLVWVSAAPRQVVAVPYISGRTRPEFTWYMSQVSDVVDSGPYPTHEVVRHAAFLTAVTGRAVAAQTPRIDWPMRSPPLPAGDPYVVLNPGSNEPGRRWPFAGYLDIAERLLGAGYRVVVVGSEAQRPGPVDTDRPGMLDLIGKTGLAQLMDVLQGAAAVVTNDTGPAHLAIALGKPTVTVIGGGHFGGFVPYPAEACPPTARFVFETMDCYHCFWRCHKRANAQDAFPCIGTIGPDAVWRALSELLPRP